MDNFVNEQDFELLKQDDCTCGRVMALVVAYSSAPLKEVVKEDQMGSRAIKQASRSARYSSALMTARFALAAVLTSCTA